MIDLLSEYRMDPTTWLYVASLMTIGIYFRFHRLLSIRNLDLIGLIAFAPGLLLIFHGIEAQGYLWLIAVSLLFLPRLLIDPAFSRRPLTEPNLAPGGMAFMAAALMFFLTANILTDRAVFAGGPAAGGGSDKVAAVRRVPMTRGPGFMPFYRAISLTRDHPGGIPPGETGGEAKDQRSAPSLVLRAGVKAVAIVCQFAIVLGMLFFGLRHFDNIQTGLAAASLYLLLPYTSLMTVRLDHLVPAAFVVWALASYRRPVIAGMSLGAAAGIAFYPFFLVPLWIGFYWRRGAVRFGVGVLTALIVLIIILLCLPSDMRQLQLDLAAMFGKGLFRSEGADGFWEFYPAVLRIPLIATLAVLAGSLALWPAEKNLGNLLSGTAALLLVAQLCLIHQSGLYMAWYAPALILVVFRPALEDRTAVRAVPPRPFGALPRLREP
ncbi:MAG: hypothetical protein GYA33_07040 [Thermogutta sp.]|nr:hypothetical protein [Thermogutta sp.]